MGQWPLSIAGCKNCNMGTRVLRAVGNKWTSSRRDDRYGTSRSKVERVSIAIVRYLLPCRLDKSHINMCLNSWTLASKETPEWNGEFREDGLLILSPETHRHTQLPNICSVVRIRLYGLYSLTPMKILLPCCYSRGSAFNFLVHSMQIIVCADTYRIVHVTGL